MDAKSIIKAELQKTSNKEEEIQLNRELARTLLKQAEIARGEGKNKNEIKMIQDLAKICQKQAEVEQRRKIRETNKMRGNKKNAFSEIIVNKEIDVLIYTQTQRRRERNASLDMDVNRKVGVHIHTQNQMKNQKTRRKKLTLPVMWEPRMLL